MERCDEDLERHGEDFSDSNSRLAVARRRLALVHELFFAEDLNAWCATRYAYAEPAQHSDLWDQGVTSCR